MERASPRNASAKALFLDIASAVVRLGKHAPPGSRGLFKRRKTAGSKGPAVRMPLIQVSERNLQSIFQLSRRTQAEGTAAESSSQ